MTGFTLQTELELQLFINQSISHEVLNESLSLSQKSIKCEYSLFSSQWSDYLQLQTKQDIWGCCSGSWDTLINIFQHFMDSFHELRN